MKKHIAIAGAGFSGSVLARELAESGKYKITVYEENRHVAGLCHTERSENTGVMIHTYGPRVFHTNNSVAWDYINQWGRFENYIHNEKVRTEAGILSYPLNLHSINQYFHKCMNPSEARDFIGSKSQALKEHNLRVKGINSFGIEIFENIYAGLIKKKWGKESEDLNHDHTDLTPLNFDYFERKSKKTFQGIPISGYTEIVRRILDHQEISVRLGQRLEPQMKDQFDYLFWSGPMDGFFQYCFGRLGYRSCVFEKFEDVGDFQGAAKMKFPQLEVPYYQIIEHKHLSPWESHEKTTCSRQYIIECKDGLIPYYPIHAESDDALLKKYQYLAQNELKVSFIGRLGTYRQIHMDEAVLDSLERARFCLDNDMENWSNFKR